MVAIGNRLTQDAKWIACFSRLDSPEIGAQLKQKMEEVAQGRMLSQDAFQDLKRFLEAGQVQTNGKSAPHQCATHVCHLQILSGMHVNKAGDHPTMLVLFMRQTKHAWASKSGRLLVGSLMMYGRCDISDC